MYIYIHIHIYIYTGVKAEEQAFRLIGTFGVAGQLGFQFKNTMVNFLRLTRLEKKWNSPSINGLSSEG